MDKNKHPFDTRIYGEGVDAYLNGDSNLTCPYDDTNRRVTWVTGWYDAFHMLGNKKKEES